MKLFYTVIGTFRIGLYNRNVNIFTYIWLSYSKGKKCETAHSWRLQVDANAHVWFLQASLEGSWNGWRRGAALLWQNIQLITKIYYGIDFLSDLTAWAYAMYITEQTNLKYASYMKRLSLCVDGEWGASPLTAILVTRTLDPSLIGPLPLCCPLKLFYAIILPN
jgi:hypothetical protein